MELSDDIELFTYEIPVIYDKVTEMVPDIWNRHKPHLVIHTGVSSIAKELTLEHRAHHQGYYACDVKGCKPLNHCCALSPTVPGTCSSQASPPPPSIKTGLDVWAAAQRVNQQKHDDDSIVPVVVSSDAGRYLCEFIYYTSLLIEPDKCIFIHVPVLNKPYSVEKLAATVKNIILALIEQIRDKPGKRKET